MGRLSDTGSTGSEALNASSPVSSAGGPLVDDPGLAADLAADTANGSNEPIDQEVLAKRVGYNFGEPQLLSQALSHRSWCAEAGGLPSNERLEFLGDAVLGLVVAEHTYLRYPDLPEGALAKVRAAVVNTAVLAEVAKGLGLGDFLRLGRGEDSSGGRSKPSILANAAEALIGAVYLDGGWDAATRLVLDLLGPRISEAAAGPGAEDFKTRLQELVLSRVAELPRYEVVGTGPDHARHYAASVHVRNELVGRGEGRSKKDAEQAAARQAWRVLGGHREDALAAVRADEETAVRTSQETALRTDEETAVRTNEGSGTTADA